ncbi:MAG: COX15/CtaA family protein [Bacteroidota bacterium]
MQPLRFHRFAQYAWALLGYLVLIILWGAFVRATGSGAGCGSHWPLCNGEVIPRAPAVETIIELSHRITSALAGFLIIGLVVWAYRRYPKGSPVRFAAVGTLVFVIIEGLIGAAIVLFEWTAENASMGRTISIALHLNNTLILLAFATLTAWWASGGRPFTLKKQGRVGWSLLGLGLGLMILSATGAVTALGDTLFEATSTAEVLNRSTDPTAHHLERLRVYHPVFAVILGAILLLSVRRTMAERPDARVRLFGVALLALYFGQMLLGMANIWLKAPVWMQLVHLLVADGIWIAYLLFGNAALATRRLEPVAEPSLSLSIS